MCWQVAFHQLPLAKARQHVIHVEPPDSPKEGLSSALKNKKHLIGHGIQISPNSI